MRRVNQSMTEPLPLDRESVPTTQRCTREGCERRKSGETHCSALCLEIDRRLTETLALIAEKGISPAAAALWAAAVSLSDQLSEVDYLSSSLRAAEPVG